MVTLWQIILGACGGLLCLVSVIFFAFFCIYCVCCRKTQGCTANMQTESNNNRQLKTLPDSGDEEDEPENIRPASRTRKFIRFKNGKRRKRQTETSRQVLPGGGGDRNNQIVIENLAEKRWYHGDISDEAAENRMRAGSRKMDGAYLVYNDPNQAHQYILLIYWQGRLITYVISRVLYDGMYMYVLEGADTSGEQQHGYPTVKELIKAHRSRPISCRSDKVVLSKCYVSYDCDTDPEVSIKESYSLVSKSWYHGNISDTIAKERLKEGSSTDGAYLVYNNPRPVQSEPYILLVNYKTEQLCWKIVRAPSDGKYVLGEDKPGVPSYSTVKELIKAHRGITGTPIRVDQDHVVTLSKSYVSRPDYS